jgi:hypothetical protein
MAGKKKVEDKTEVFSREQIQSMFKTNRGFKESFIEKYLGKGYVKIILIASGIFTLLILIMLVVVK